MQVIGKTADDNSYICILSEEEIGIYLQKPEEQKYEPPTRPRPINEFGVLADETKGTIVFDCASMDAANWLTANCNPLWGKLFQSGEHQFLLQVSRNYDMAQIGEWLVYNFYNQKNINNWVDGLEEQINKP